MDGQYTVDHTLISPILVYCHFTEGKTEAQTNNVLKATQLINERHSIEFYISKTVPDIPY